MAFQPQQNRTHVGTDTQAGPRAKRRLQDAPKPVVERWMRIRGITWAHAISRAYMRFKLPISERERRKALEETFDTIKHYAIKNEHGRFRGTS